MNPSDQELVDRAMERADPRYTMSSSALIVELAARLSSLSQSNARMARALEFYRDNWVPEPTTRAYLVPTDALCNDEGKAARSAIEDLAAPPADNARYIPDIVKNAMLVAWNYICDDTKCHPLDIEHGKGKFLIFTPRHWARMAGDIVAAQIPKLLAPPADSKPVAWMYELTNERFETPTSWDYKISKFHPGESTAVRNIVPLYAHPPADSLDAAIREGWRIANWRCELQKGQGGWFEVGEGPTPLAAFRAALERIPK